MVRGEYVGKVSRVVEALEEGLDLVAEVVSGEMRLSPHAFKHEGGHCSITNEN